MKSFNKIFAAVCIVIAAVFAAANFSMLRSAPDRGRQYRVDAHRAAVEIAEKGLEGVDMSRYETLTGIAEYSPDTAGFFDVNSDYVVKEVNGRLYRIDYISDNSGSGGSVFATNVILAAMSAVVIAVLIFVRVKIIAPFNRLKDVPYELSKGNLTAPLTESKSRFFGKFVWGMNILRENIERQKSTELELQKEKKTLLLSLSHDIKTPLSAIKLYSKALSKGLYTDKAKQTEAAESINEKACEIERYVSQIIEAAREDFLHLEVSEGEFYLSELIGEITAYYSDKLSMQATEFSVEKYSDCMLRGDIERAVEVVQNIIENAIKYGDGKMIRIEFSDEEDCRLVSVVNSGCTLPDTEIPHIFDSFWRGSNIGSNSGSGLGLYICRQLMNKMGGEIFANISGDTITVTSVFVRA